MKPSKSSRDWAFRIKDILHAIDKIEQYTKGMTAAEFKKNELVIDAVIRNFEIIGEASNGVPLVIQKAHPQIPWRQTIVQKAIHQHCLHWTWCYERMEKPMQQNYSLRGR